MKKIKVMSEMAAENLKPEILFWVGCAGSYDARAQRVTKALSTILQNVGIKFAILGPEESCTGDPAKRAGNEFAFMMQAIKNIELLKGYDIQKIVTGCPHCFNTLKNEYPELGADFEVVHHTQLISTLIEEGRLTIEGGAYKGKKITYHDSCYLGRVNGEYEAPRKAIEALDGDLTELKRSRANGLCCGAGGAQMFKENEPGDKRINTERAEEVLSSGADIVAANCPFCITMISDGITAKEKQDDVMVFDISELIVNANGWS